MILSRTSARWTSRVSQNPLKATPRSAHRHTRRIVQRRGYASASGDASHSTHKSSSDLPWAIGSLIVTVPSVFYLIQPQLSSNKNHGHGHGHADEGHGEEHSEGHEHEEENKSEGGSESSEGEDEQPDDQGESGGGAEEDSANEQKTDEENEGQPGEASRGRNGPMSPSDKGPDDEAHETEGGGNVEGVQFKGATSGGTRDGEQGDTRKHIPDAKGGSKKRIESHYGNKQGEATEPEQDADDKDLGAASKPAKGAGSSTTQSSKQEGLSNTDTKHSTDIQNSPEKSKKGEGMPETAKQKGTVDPSRPQA